MGLTKQQMVELEECLQDGFYHSYESEISSSWSNLLPENKELIRGMVDALIRAQERRACVAPDNFHALEYLP